MVLPSTPVTVLGLGDAGLDLVLRVPRLPRHDEKILAASVDRYPGGVVANVLCALSRLGTRSGFVGCLGDDEFGTLVRGSLSDAGVDLSRLLVKKGERTYFSVSLLDDTGEKALVIAPTSTIFPGPEDVLDETVKGADLLHTTALRIDTTLKAIALARRHGLEVSVDLEPSTLQQGREGVWQVLAATQLLFVNRHAVRMIFPSNIGARHAGLELLKHGPTTVVLTLGDEGSLVVTNRHTVHTPAFPVPVRDTTGAGDCFNAAFIHGYLRAWPIEQTALFATAAAALSIMAVGAQTGQPGPDEVSAFLESWGHPPG